MPLIRPYISKQMEQDFKAFLRERKATRKQQLADELAAASAKIRAEREAAARTPLQRLVNRLQATKPMRTFKFFSGKDGQLLGAGLAYQAVFALFAALWFSFSVVGLIFAGNRAFQQGLVSGLNAFVPGLIGGDNAVVPVDTLLNTGVLGWSSVISLLTILLTTIGFVATLRGGLLIIFETPAPTRNIVVQKLFDLAIVIAFGILILVTAAISVITAAASRFVFDLVGIPTDNWFAYAVSGIIGLLIVALLDMALLLGVMRVIAGVKLPLARMWRVALSGGLILGFLQTLGSGLLGAPKSNPLFASFAVIFGLLIYFNIVCEIILFCAAWLKVGMEERTALHKGDGVAVEHEG